MLELISGSSIVVEVVHCVAKRFCQNDLILLTDALVGNSPLPFHLTYIILDVYMYRKQGFSLQDALFFRSKGISIKRRDCSAFSNMNHPVKCVVVWR